MIEIEVQGQRYEVPQGLTVLRACEWAGFRLIRGIGCRGGFCGACGTVYRLPDDPTLHFGLACQTLVEPGMTFGQIPFFPTRHSPYHIDELQAAGGTLLALYPEIIRCFGCNTCTKACPQGLDVLQIMSAALRDDLQAVAETSFDCIQCELCAARCPADLAPSEVALVARRLYGKYLAPPAAHLHQRISEIEDGQFNDEIASLKAMPVEALRARYNARQIEP